MWYLAGVGHPEYELRRATINNKVLVTGGAGFIGSHLAEELVKQGYQVIILDNLSTGKLDNIKEFRNQVEFIEGSITDPHLLTNLFQGVDYIFHLAAMPSVPKSIENPRASHDVNATATLDVLLAAKQNNVKRVIFASSSAVYGDTPSLPKQEDMAPRPLSPYAVGKLASENYCRVFQDVYQLPTVCLRYFNVYGPRQDPNSQYAAAIPNFINKVLEDKPPIIFGDGQQTRDFTFVRDVVGANILAMKNDISGVFNISRGDSISINRLVELIMEVIGKQLAPIHQEARRGDIKHSLADISKARAFGFNARWDLKDGLIETLKWFKDR